MNASRIYDYLSQSRERVFDAVRPLTPKQYHHKFTIGLKTISTTLTHIMICEWAYMERIAGRTPPPYETWPIQDEKPPAFDVLENAWRGQMTNARQIIDNESDWNRTLTFDSIVLSDGRQFRVTTTPMDMLLQLLTHEVHHRAQAMAMLRELNVAKPLIDLDYSYFAFQRKQITP